MTETEERQKQLLNQLFILAAANDKRLAIEVKPSKPKSKAGGIRAGSGRPEGSTRVTPDLQRVTIAITIPKWMADGLTNTDVPPGRLIEAIIQFHLGSIEKIADLFENA